MPIKAIGFDFDGTLIQSEEQKKKEMKKVFQEYFGVQKIFLNAYRQVIKKALNRKEKVNLLFQKLMKRKPTVKELKKIEEHFGEHYQKVLRTCPLFQCSNLVQELKKQMKFLFLLSLENKREVQKVAQHCGLAKYFDGLKEDLQADFRFSDLCDVSRRMEGMKKVKS